MHHTHWPRDSVDNGMVGKTFDFLSMNLNHESQKAPFPYPKICIFLFWMEHCWIWNRCICEIGLLCARFSFCCHVWVRVYYILQGYAIWFQSNPVECGWKNHINKFTIINKPKQSTPKQCNTLFDILPLSRGWNGLKMAFLRYDIVWNRVLSR